MIDDHTVQTLREIVAEMGRDSVCEKPHAFAGAILDMCDANDVKLLTTVLRSHYSNRLMAYFQSGSGDAADWTQQKTFLIDESGMSVENAESVLDVLWKAMGWQRPRPSQFGQESGKPASPKADEKHEEEYVNINQADASADDGASRKDDNQSQKGSDNTAQTNTSAGNAGNVLEENAGLNAGSGVEAKPLPQQNGIYWLPILIAATWLFLVYLISKDNLFEGFRTMYQNEGYPVLPFLAVPVLAALLAAVRKTPRSLRKISAVVLGFISAINAVICLYWLGEKLFSITIYDWIIDGLPQSTLLELLSIVGPFLAGVYVYEKMDEDIPE